MNVISRRNLIHAEIYKFAINTTEMALVEETISGGEFEICRRGDRFKNSPAESSLVACDVDILPTRSGAIDYLGGDFHVHVHFVFEDLTEISKNLVSDDNCDIARIKNDLRTGVAERNCSDRSCNNIH